MKLDEFLRLHAVRAPNLMWFLGAGASAAAGMPTAGQMIWDFKRLLYCTEQQIPIESCADLTNPVLQARLQAHFDAQSGFPSRDNDEEYAAYFEAAYRTEADRRRYIDQHTRAAAPSYGHYALAALLAADRVRAVWMTNMDRAVEDAWAEMTGNTGRLTVATLDTADIALAALNEGRFPLVVKLHGDYQSSRLKNVGVELRAQDERLRHALVEGCRRWGLVVVGYSGRDMSVMDALEAAIDGGRGFPLGLFWFHRSGGALSRRVARLLASAQAANLTAELIEVETFDELLDAVLLVERELPASVTAFLDTRRPSRVSNAPLPAGRGGWPVIRMNALPVLEWPQTARLIRCEIGGYSEVREAVAAAGVELVVGRRRQGVVGFGPDADMRTAFGGRPGFALDLYPIEARRLAYESAELGILYDALRRALGRVVPLLPRGVGRFLAVDPAQSGAALFEPLRRTVGDICGQVAAAENAPWMEAIEVRLEFRSGRLWLILQPTVWVEAVADGAPGEARADFIRARLSSRYNRQANDLLVAWRDVLLGGDHEATFSAFETDGGVDATFRIGPVSAFTRRQIAP